MNGKKAHICTSVGGGKHFLKVLKALAWKGVFLNVATYLCPFSSAWKGAFLNSNLFMSYFSPSFLFIFFRQIQGVTGALDLLLLRSRQQHPARVSPTSCRCHGPAQRPGTGMCASPAQGWREAGHCRRSSPKEQLPDTAEHSVLLTSPRLLHQQMGLA